MGIQKLSTEILDRILENVLDAHDDDMYAVYDEAVTNFTLRPSQQMRILRMSDEELKAEEERKRKAMEPPPMMNYTLVCRQWGALMDRKLYKSVILSPMRLKRAHEFFTDARCACMQRLELYLTLPPNQSVGRFNRYTRETRERYNELFTSFIEDAFAFLSRPALQNAKFKLEITLSADSKQDESGWARSATEYGEEQVSGKALYLEYNGNIDDLEELGGVSALAVRSSDKPMSFDPATILRLATKMPRAEELDLDLAEYSYRTAQRIAVRQELAAALDEITNNLRLKVFALCLQQPQCRHSLYQPPSLATPDADNDVLSLALRRVSQMPSLLTFKVAASVEPCIFPDAPKAATEEAASDGPYSKMGVYKIMPAAITPSGQWLLRFKDRMGYESPDEHDSDTGSIIELRGTFTAPRLRPCQLVASEYLLRAAQAARQMPKMVQFQMILATNAQLVSFEDLDEAEEGQGFFPVTQNLALDLEVRALASDQSRWRMRCKAEGPFAVRDDVLQAWFDALKVAKGAKRLSLVRSKADSAFEISVVE